MADTKIEARQEEYKLLKNKIDGDHDASLFGSATPYLFDSVTLQSYTNEFVLKNCNNESMSDLTGLSDACNRKFGNAVMTRLSRKYFAANPDEINMSCRVKPAICQDPQTAEVLFRQIHNEDVEKSRRAKLEQLEVWYSGKMNDQILERELHFDFKYIAGKLVTKIPF